MSRTYNFNAGPAVLPEDCLLEAKEELLDFNNTGISILECSHRSKEYESVHNEAKANIKELLKLDDNYDVLFLQGGASLQFAMIPMNFLGNNRSADYVDSGYWAGKAIKEAQMFGRVNIAADTNKDVPKRMPALSELKFSDDAVYIHITSNETIAGTQWKVFPKVDRPLVADMSSDILSRPFNVKDFSLIYAGAQKNLGPAGVVVVIIRKDFAEKANKNLPTMLKYSTYIEENSLYNTPPCFAIYFIMLVTRWIKKKGSDNIFETNIRKASKIYSVIDSSGGFYIGAAAPESRSDMNVTFRIAKESLEAVFIKEAEARGLKGLKGHRSVGGLRASIYNAMPEAGVDALVEFMKDFQHRYG